jgi:hypothetical protein
MNKSEFFWDKTARKYDQLEKKDVFRRYLWYGSPYHLQSEIERHPDGCPLSFYRHQTFMPRMRWKRHNSFSNYLVLNITAPDAVRTAGMPSASYLSIS